jgi:uncharacterized membrane protein
MQHGTANAPEKKMQSSLTSPQRSDSSQQAFSHSSEHSGLQQSNRRSYRSNGAARDEPLARALGWFSIGLGVAQILAPRAMSRTTGVADRPMLLRAVGVREIASGVGILSRRRPTPWLWARVAGDAMDLAMLGAAVVSPGARRNRIGITAAAVAGVTALDVLSGMQHREMDSTGRATPASGALPVEQSIAVNRSPDECYRFWRNFENFPRFMKHLESVQTTADNRTHWKAKGPAGISVEWDAEVTVDQPGELLAWHSVDSADVDHAGTVRFEKAPGGRGTIVRVDMEYNPPGGQAGALFAKLFGEEPAMQIKEDLRHFKQLLETGEIPTTEGQPSGRRSPVARLLLRKGAPG